MEVSGNTSVIFLSYAMPPAKAYPDLFENKLPGYQNVQVQHCLGLFYV